MTAPETPFYQREEGCRVLGLTHWPMDAAGVRTGVQACPSWSVPGFFVLKVPRFGRELSPSAVQEVVSGLADMARKRRVLRVHVEAWTEDPNQMEAIGQACVANGFHPFPPRSYTRTVWVELLANSEDAFMRLSPQARRRVRAAAKRGFCVRQLRSPALSPLLHSLMAESFARTGGVAPRIRWDEWIELSLEHPSLLRLVGLFRDEDARSERPFAFAAAVRHGDVVEYAHAGATRCVDTSVPLLYAPTWRLMCWAREAGARWWDFGGISTSGPHVDQDDPRSGVDTFKFCFSRNVIDIGREWVLEPRPWLARAGEFLRSLVGR